MYFVNNFLKRQNFEEEKLKSILEKIAEIQQLMKLSLNLARQKSLIA